MTARTDTQPARLLRWLRANPGASGLEIIAALAIPKYTGRISDLRDQGHVIHPVRRKDGRTGYVVEEPRPVTSGETVEMFR